jgi:hypothetical protein
MPKEKVIEYKGEKVRIIQFDPKEFGTCAVCEKERV